jgi:16S rRNA (cytidine1402-2'-O)-methyltransferase
MTKFYEEFYRSEIDELELFKFNLKGELTIVISEKKEDKKISQILNESDKRIINKMINKLSIKEISSVINENNKIPKKVIYDYCLALKNEK